MISKETAYKIYSCHQEIENSKKLLTDMAEILKKDKEKTPPRLFNAFGEQVGLQLGVPSGENGQRIFNVAPALAIDIIEQHIKDKKKRLTELNAVAKLELYK